jgi:NAD(P)-dependent dehydrogenase (short-subunit alcohol dehydrogenase family)
MSELSYVGRTVLITGAGRGLGRAHAFAFAARGAAVVVNDLDESAHEVAADIRRSEGVAETLVGDVADPAVAEAAVAQAINRFGQLDVVVANAGIDAITPLREVTPQLLTEYFRVHVLGTWGVCSAVWPHFVDRHYGRIVTTTSAAGYFGLCRALPYATAKGALHAMTQTLAAEGARNGITANAIAPFAASRLARNRTRSAPQLYDAIERFAPPSAVSPVVLWLAHETTTVSGAAFEVGAGGVSRIEVGVGETAPVEADPASWTHGELTVPPVEAADRPLTRWLSRQAAGLSHDG